MFTARSVWPHFEPARLGNILGNGYWPGTNQRKRFPVYRVEAFIADEVFEALGAPLQLQEKLEWQLEL